MNIKRIMIVIVMMLTTMSFSQEVKIIFNSGFYSLLQVENNKIEVENKYGASFGATYSYNLDKNYGISSALEFSSYRANISLKAPSLRYQQIDDTGTGFHLDVVTKDYKERLVLNSLEVPLKFFYDNNSKNKKSIGYYAGVGAKFIIPIKAKSTIQMNGIKTEGFYPDTNTRVKNLKNHGFGDWNDKYQSVQTINLSSSIALTGEFGMSFKLNKETIYVGIFGDYGITDMYRKHEVNGTLIKYNPNGKPKEGLGITNLKGIERIDLLNFGIQIKYSLQKGRHY